MSSHGESDFRRQFSGALCTEQLANLIARGGEASGGRLASVIFDDIVPRLQMLHHDLSAKEAEHAFTREEISEFGEILINDDSHAADRFVQKMRAQGHSEDRLFLGLMAETARHLGALWEDDRCSFVDVTIGVARLQKMLCLSQACEPGVNDSQQRIALCSVVGERHVYGVEMVACFMRSAGWDVDLQVGIEPDEVADAVARDWFAVVGFTLSAESEVETLCRAIQSGRAASANPAIGILVGGPLFRAQPNLVAQVGADAMAADAASASLLAKRLLLRQQSRGRRHNGHCAEGAQ